MIGNVCLSTVSSLTGELAAGSTISNNLFYAADTAVNWGASSNVVFVRNTLFTRANHGVVLTWKGATPRLNSVDYNDYYVAANAMSRGNGVAFMNIADQLAVPLGPWQSGYGFDLHSVTNAPLPPDTVRVLPNADEPKRAHIAVANWTKKNNVNVNLSGVLTAGDTYRLYSAQNFKAGPVQAGIYDGTSISVPMTNLTSAPILYGTNANAQGEITAQPAVTSPAFAAFVLIGSARVPSPPAPPTGLAIVPLR
jgi:hypothetical protein